MRIWFHNVAHNLPWGWFAVVAVAVVSAVNLLGSVSENDLYWHLLVGRDIVENYRLTGNPDFVFGPSQPWVTTQAVSEVLMYWWYSVFGLDSFAFLRVAGGVLVSLSVMWSVFVLAPRSASRSLRLWAAAGFGFLATQWVVVQERPQTVSFILLPLLAVWMVRLVYTGRAPNVVLVFVVTMVWTWFHGTALMVAPVLGAAWLLHVVAVRFGFISHAAPLGRFGVWGGAVTAVAAAAATLVNPVGVRIYEQALLIADSASVGIQEWKAPFPDVPSFYLAMPLLLLLWLVAALVLSRSSFFNRLLVVDFVLIVPFVVYSETANRLVPVAVLLTVGLVARRWVQAVGVLWRRPVSSLPVAWVLPVSVVMVCVAGVFVAGSLSSVDNVGGNTPKRILSGLASSDGDRFVVGSYNVMGRVQLFTDANVVTAVDGRADRLSADQLRAFIGFSRGDDGWRDTLFGSYSGATDYVDVAVSGVVPELLDLGWVLRCEETDASGLGWVWLTAPGVEGVCPVVADVLVPRVDR
jgi:hypothetical protein